jgi:hypothetical protein
VARCVSQDGSSEEEEAVRAAMSSKFTQPRFWIYSHFDLIFALRLSDLEYNANPVGNVTSRKAAGII